MTRDILMPKMGYDMTEGRLARWFKREGDLVSRGEPIAEIETDKVTIELEAFDSGVLQRIVAPEGARVPVGACIAILATPDEPVTLIPSIPASTAGAPADPAGPPGPSSPAAIAAPGSFAAAEGSRRSAPPARTAAGDQINASPLARRLAREHGVDLSTLRGTGPEGRITREDVLRAAHAQDELARPLPAASPPVATAPGPAHATDDGVKSRPLSRLQQVMGRRMVASKTQVPHFYLTLHVDMSAALALRQQLNAGADAADKITINDLLIKAIARSLGKFPMLNASFADDALTLHEEIAICIAVAIEDGLVTPVLHHAERKTLLEIARESRSLIERARAGKSRAEDYEGGTFTVSNLGMFDIDTFIAIINPPRQLFWRQGQSGVFQSMSATVW